MIKVHARGPHDQHPEVVATNIVRKGAVVFSTVPAYEDSFLATRWDVNLQTLLLFRVLHLYSKAMKMVIQVCTKQNPT